MPVKNLSAYFAPDLVLPYGDCEYVVRPPSRDVGLKLAAVNAASAQIYETVTGRCPQCGRTGQMDFPEDTKALLEEIGNVPLPELSLGKETHDLMVANGVPEVDIDTLGLYAHYYWTLGEVAADEIMKAALEARVGGTPKDLRTSRTGRHTVSGSQTRTESIPGIEPQPTSDPSTSSQTPDLESAGETS